MDCPRCGAPNLPGLPTCVDCGQDLAAEHEVPENLVPQVEVANPLAERRPKPPRPPLRRRLSAFAHVGRVRHLPWEAFGAGVVGLLKGVVPGLMPARRREWRVAAVQVAAVLAPISFLLLYGGREAVATYSFLVAFGWSLSPVREAHRAMDTPEPYRSSAAWLLGLGAAALFAVGVRLLLAPIPPMTFQFTVGGSLLPSASCRVVPLSEPPRTGMLVAFDRADIEERLAWLDANLEGGDGTAGAYEGYLRVYPFFASPVVALPGEVLSAGRGGVRVDGVMSTAQPITSWPRETLATGLEGTTVPEGMVAVWDWIPYPTAHSLHLTLVPEDRVLGAVAGCYVGEEGWTPLRWPEDAMNHREAVEQP